MARISPYFPLYEPFHGCDIRAHETRFHEPAENRNIVERKFYHKWHILAMAVKASVLFLVFCLACIKTIILFLVLLIDLVFEVFDGVANLAVTRTGV